MSDLKLRILYLAKYAPLSEDYRPEFHLEDGVASLYHYEIFSILKQLGYDVKGSRNLDDLYLNSKNYDYVFSLYNRMPFRNSEVFPSALCEYLKIPYLGGSPVIRSIAEDKNLTKILATYCDIPTPLWTIFRSANNLLKPDFSPPYFIKPRYGASSEFVDEKSLAYSWEDAVKKVNELLKANTEVIIEQFAPGINLTLPIIFADEPIVLPIVQAISNIPGNILTYKQKRMIEAGITRDIFPNAAIGSKTIEASMKLYMSLSSPLDYARFDFRYDPENDMLTFLEFNVCSNLGSHSSICQAADSIGLSQTELVRRIVEHSLQRQQISR